MVTPIVYNILEKDDAISYLPYVVTSGLHGHFQNNSLQDQNTFYRNLYTLSEPNAYAFRVNEYEKSLLGRISKKINAGRDFYLDKVGVLAEPISQKNKYLGNWIEEVLIMNPNSTGISVEGYYSQGALFIDYNLLNLPSQIKHYYEAEGSTTDYAYLTDGRKITANFNGGEGLEYLGSFVYLRDKQGGLSNESTDFVMGRIENSTAGYKINYHITDHLSSVRAIATSTGGGTAPTITSRMDYHPFGTPHVSSPLPAADQKHRYTFCGKEEQRIASTVHAQFKVAVMDQGARHYIPSTMQFTSHDPLAIKYPHISPYTYCAANPILYVDPDGKDWFTATYNGESFYFFDKIVKSQKDITTHYGADNQASYLGTSSSFSNSGDKFSLNEDGSFEINGNEATAEYNKDGAIHIGNDTFTNMSTVNDNIYGSYLGGSNPQLNGSKKADSYAVPPLNRLDYSAYLHDKGYDAKEANGVMGAFLDTDVIGADFNLAVNSYIASKTSFNIIQVFYASATSYLFLNIARLKVAKKGGEITVQYIKNLFK